MPTRIATPSGAAAVAHIYAPAVTASHTSFESTPPSPDQMARRITATLPRYPWLVDEADGVVAGYAYAVEHGRRAAYQWSVDVSVYVGVPARGRRPRWQSGCSRRCSRSCARLVVRQRLRGHRATEPRQHPSPRGGRLRADRCLPW